MCLNFLLAVSKLGPKGPGLLADLPYNSKRISIFLKHTLKMLCDRAYVRPQKSHNKSRLKSDQISFLISYRRILQSSIIHGVLVPSPVTVIKHPNESNVRAKGFISAHSLSSSSSWWGCQGSRSFKQTVESQTQ